MSLIRLPYIDHFKDRHGTTRYYFRRPGGKRTPLPGYPGSDEFMRAYAAAEANEPPPEASRERGEPGTFDRLLGLYFASVDYKRLKAPTQRAYRLAMEKLVRDEKIGHRTVSGLKREHIKKMMAARVDRPAAANGALKKLRILIKFAIDLGWRQDDPTIALRKLKEGEHHTWTDEEIAAFEAKWPTGTLQGTAFALLLFTGQRLSDVVRMSWRDVDAAGTAIQVTQEKTGTKLWIPLHPDLTVALGVWPKTHFTLVTTAYGEPFTAKGFGNKMADAITAAGLPDRCVTHGIRKAAARRLAEAGCTTHQVASITGHKSLAEIERYTREVNQRTTAGAAILKIASRKRKEDEQGGS